MSWRWPTVAEHSVGVEKLTIGQSSLHVLTQPSHPQVYSRHFSDMLAAAGQLIDKNGEPHALLPRGLVVGRPAPRQPSTTVVSPTRSLSKFSSGRLSGATRSSRSISNSSLLQAA